MNRPDRIKLSLGMNRLPPLLAAGWPVRELKTWLQPFKAMWEGRKPYEVRRDDRTPPYAVGDLLLSMEWNEGQERYEERSMLIIVTCKSEGGTWGLPDGLCVLGIRILDREEHGQVSWPRN